LKGWIYWNIINQREFIFEMNNKNNNEQQP